MSEQRLSILVDCQVAFESWLEVVLQKRKERVGPSDRTPALRWALGQRLGIGIWREVVVAIGNFRITRVSHPDNQHRPVHQLVHARDLRQRAEGRARVEDIYDGVATFRGSAPRASQRYLKSSVRARAQRPLFRTFNRHWPCTTSSGSYPCCHLFPHPLGDPQEVFPQYPTNRLLGVTSPQQDVSEFL